MPEISAKKMAKLAKQGRRYRQRRALRNVSKSRLSLYSPIKEYKFVRSFMYPTLVLNWSTAIQNPVFTPQLGYMTNASEFAALFDEWRLDYVKLKFECLFDGKDLNQPVINVTGGTFIGGGQLGSLKNIRSVIDYTDSTGLSTESDALEYSCCKTHRMGRSFTIAFKPKMLVESYRSIASTAYSPVPSKFHATSDSAVPHYGLKLLVPICCGNANDANKDLAIYQCRVTYHFTCRNTK